MSAQPKIALGESFALGNAKVAAAGLDCCGKPRGCTMTHEGCAYLRHPWKRAVVFGDPEVRCQATCLRGDWVMQCVLSNGHDGPCDPQPLRRNV